MSRYPSIQTLDPEDYLCDEKKCGAVEEGCITYLDDGRHLNEYGSSFLYNKQYFEKLTTKGNKVNMSEMTTSGAPKVSIIMNCYNGERYLREAIESIYSQSFQDWEIVFWDNASTDASAKIAQSYDDKLCYFRGDVNIPLGAARSEAINRARGELIAFLDCDDVWLPEKLATQVERMTQECYDICYAGLIRINKDGTEVDRSIPKYKSGLIFEDLLRQFDINIPTLMIRKNLLLTLRMNFDPKITASEEYCLLMQLAVNHAVCIVPDILAKYRVHDRALTNQSISQWADEREYTLNLICSKNPGIRNKFRSAFNEAYARAKYYRARYYMFNNQKKMALKELSKAMFVNYRYFALLLVLMLPKRVWNYVHEVRSKRVISTASSPA